MLKIKSIMTMIRHFTLSTALLLCLVTPLSAGNPYSAYYCSDTDRLLWFIHASDIHVGTSGTTDSTNLTWLVGAARNTIKPSFIVVSGDLTDSTNGNFLGYPNGPYQAEWDLYKNILTSAGVTADSYFDIPGNHDAYNDQYFAYYLANSVQGRATGRTQASWTRLLSGEKYLFLGINTADNSGDPFSIFWPYGDYAGLDSSELSFISSELDNNQDASLTLIFGHHPLAATDNTQDTYLYYGKDEFVSLMDTQGASVYGYGHTHVSSQSYYAYAKDMPDGVFYFNVSALGKDSPNQYTVTAIDCNGISSVTQNVGAWPVVLITAPMDRRLGNIVNPYAYTVNNGALNPIRALVFDPGGVSQVQFRVNGGGWLSMGSESASGNPNLWSGVWDASSMGEGECTIEVEAKTGSGVRSDTVTTYVKSNILPTAGVTGLQTGKYVTTGTKKSKTTQFFTTQTFTQGETVIVQAAVKDDSDAALANATVELSVSGPSTLTLTTGPSNSSGIAEAKWTTTASSKRGLGTPTGTYRAQVTAVTAAGHEWDGDPDNATVLFSINPK